MTSDQENDGVATNNNASLSNAAAGATLRSNGSMTMFATGEPTSDDDILGARDDDPDTFMSMVEFDLPMNDTMESSTFLETQDRLATSTEKLTFLLRVIEDALNVIHDDNGDDGGVDHHPPSLRQHHATRPKRPRE